MLPLSEKVRVCRKKAASIGLGTVCGFRHPRGSWNISLPLPTEALQSVPLPPFTPQSSKPDHHFLNRPLLILLTFKQCLNRDADDVEGSERALIRKEKSVNPELSPPGGMEVLGVGVVGYGGDPSTRGLCTALFSGPLFHKTHTHTTKLKYSVVGKSF